MSKYGWTVPLRTKTGAEIVKEFQTIFKEVEGGIARMYAKKLISSYYFRTRRKNSSGKQVSPVTAVKDRHRQQ